jgi:hypothetical protein
MSTERTEVDILRAQLDEHRRRVSYLNDALARKNRELDALHYVWCDGGCAQGVHRWTDDELTEDVVITAERQAARLRSWWTNAQARRR